MCEEENKIQLTNDSELIYMSFHAREEAKNWTKVSRLALNQNILIQAAVLSVYASELYIKSLLMILGVDAIKECKDKNGHKLLSLFRKLPDENLKYSIAINVLNMCDSIQEQFNNEEEVLSSFEKQLENISTAYTKYRYLYEKYAKKTDITIPLDLVFSLSQILEEECNLLEYEKIDENGNPVDKPDPKISYHIIGKGWVDDLTEIGKG